MSFRKRLRRYLPISVRSLPFDLAVLLAAVLVTVLAVSLPVVRETSLRVVVSLPFLLFVPGCAFVAALFPEAPRDDNNPVTASKRHLSNLERVTFSLASSVALVPLIGFALNFTPWGIRLRPMLVALGLFTTVCVGVAAKRRSELPRERQFRVTVGDWYHTLRDDFLSRETRTDAALNIGLALAVLLATASVGYALVDQRDGEQYTELFLLTQGDEKLVTDDYPTNLTATESRSIVVGVRNHEHERMRYTVVTELQRVRSEGGTTTVVEEEQLDEFDVTLASNESQRQVRVLTPTLTGDGLRLIFLLYRGDAPEDPSMDNAYRRVHLQVNVSAPNQ